MKNEITIYELIGLIKNNEAPKEIEYDGKKYSFNNYLKTYDLFSDYNWQFILDNKVTILNEEKEWEDNDYKVSCLSKKINKLIKNQKKIIEKLEEK